MRSFFHGCAAVPLTRLFAQPSSSLQGYWNEYQIKHYGRTRVDYNNTESDIDEDEDEDEPEENWKVDADESESDIDTGDVSDEEDERRIR